MISNKRTVRQRHTRPSMLANYDYSDVNRKNSIVIAEAEPTSILTIEELLLQFSLHPITVN